MQEAALTFERLAKRFGSTLALDAVSFEVRRGEMFGLIGPDGAGKTTAIRVACGLTRPDGGSVRVLGHDPVREHHRITGALGYLSQRFSLYGDLTIDENIAFFAEIHGVRRYQDARNRLLDLTQLTPFRARRADRLSGGMKQKLALACTLVHEPEILLLDEPTTGVDPVARREFWKLLSEFLARGLTIVMATPYLDEAERCGRVLLLHEGRVLAIDEPSALQRAAPGRMFEVITDSDRPPLDLLQRMPDVLDAQAFGDRAHVTVGAVEETALGTAVERTLAARGIRLVGMRRILPTLEDVFIGMLAARSAEDSAGAAANRPYRMEDRQ